MENSKKGILNYPSLKPYACFEVIHQALTISEPEARYQIAGTEGLSVNIATMLPQVIQDAILRRIP